MFVARALFFGVCFFCHFHLPVAFAAEGEPDPVAPADAVLQIQALRAEIAYHDDRYYRLASPVISDAEYDVLKRRLAGLLRLQSQLSRVSRIGDDRLSRFGKSQHAAPMLSLDKVYSKSGLSDFHNRICGVLGVEDVEYLVEPKFDGMAISVVYEEGRLVRATTRGDGREGDDVTANVLNISGVPSRLGGGGAMPERVELRGEIYLTFDAFREINRQQAMRGEAAYRSIRNLAAGSVKLKDSSEVAARGLSVVFFGYGSYEPAGMAPISQAAFYAEAREWGLPVVERVQTALGLRELELAIDRIEAGRAAYPFPTDGAVAKVNLAGQQDEIGSTGYAPRWALAYKFEAERVSTRVLAITLQVGRTGVITPVAELEPVALSGSRISRSTLHHFGNVASRDIRIGDTVFLEKAGEVIPSVLGVDLSRRPAGSIPYLAPRVCPSCDALLLGESEGAILYCTNSQCPAQRQRRLEHFASAQGVHILGMGPARIAAWVKKGDLKTVADFYRIEESGAVAESIESSKTAALWRFVRGLGIRGMGEKRSRQLAAALGDLRALLAIAPADFEPGGAAEGLSFGHLALQHFSLEENRRMVEELIELGVRPATEVSRGRGPLVGKVFVLTGRLEGFSRREAIKLIESAGGVVRGSVSGRTDYLLAGDAAGAKLDEARRRGVEVLSEIEWLELLEE